MVVNELNLLDLTVFAEQTLQRILGYLEEEVANVENILIRIVVIKACRGNASAQPAKVDSSRYIDLPIAFSEPEN